MGDHLFNSRYSVGHAKRRIAELERTLDAFDQGKPYAMFSELDADTSEICYKVRLTKSLPIELNGIIFDVVSNLRASLDHAGYAVATADGRSGAHAHFPFGQDIEDIQFRSDKKGGRSRQIRKEIFNLMVAFKPYKGGNQPLLALNELCNTHKHEVVLPTLISSTSYEIQNLGGGQPMSGGFKLFCGVWDRAKNEMEFARTIIGFELKGDFKFTLNVVVGNIDIIEGEPIIGVLNTITGEVERVLMAIEAEAIRIGIFK